MAEFHEGYTATVDDHMTYERLERERVGRERWAKQSWWKRQNSCPEDFTPPPERCIFPDG